MSLKRIVSLVSSAKHPVSGTSKDCHNDSLAMVMALSLAKLASAKGEVLHAGSADDPALQDYLALGAEQINVIATSHITNNLPAKNHDHIVAALAENLADVDLILTGSRAEGGQDSGLLPYLLASALNVPIVANALEVKKIKTGLEILQFLPKGKRRLVNVTLPAVVVIHPLAPVTLRYAHAKKMMGNIHCLPCNVTSKTAVSETNANDLVWHIQPMRKPIKLKALEVRTGHARLQSAITSESKNGTVVNDENSVEKAQVILRYLREHRLINF